MSISDKQDDSNEAGKLLKHLTEGLHHWKKRWLFHLLHYFIASYALLLGGQKRQKGFFDFSLFFH